MHSSRNYWVEVSSQLYASAALLPCKEPAVQHWVKDWVGPRAGLDVVAKG
jgi:hypothetical protein